MGMGIAFSSRTWLTVVVIFALYIFAPVVYAENELDVPYYAPINAEIGLPYPMPDTPNVALIDYNRDGYVDVIIGGQYWRNDGQSRLVKSSRVMGAYHSMGDFDSDGDLDIFATDYSVVDKKIKAQRWLYRCDGDGEYTDILKGSGLEDEQTDKKSKLTIRPHQFATRAHGFLDYNNDGHLDLSPPAII